MGPERGLGLTAAGAPSLDGRRFTAGSPFLANYKGKILPLKDGQVTDLGDRFLEIVFTPGHTPGSTTFIETNAGYGFSGDSFGSGNLLAFGSFSMLTEACQKAGAYMEKYGIKYFYPGYYNGKNPDTKQRVNDLMALSRDILSGKIKGEVSSRGMMEINLVSFDRGVGIHYSENALR